MGDGLTLRELDPARDRGLLERLWEAALGPAWPVLPGGLDLVRGGLVAEGPGGGLGAVALDPAGSIPFEAATFPSWLRWFDRPAGAILVARDARGAVVGSLLFHGPPGATIYAPMLGPMAGTIGCVGVAAGARGAGVGSAMVVRASELLRDAGTRACHIGWTERERFYRRLGYVPWRRYRMASRPIGRSGTV